jgi:hypothetical protein
MADREQLMHKWHHHMSKGYICGKCGATASDWNEVEDISSGPCVRDNDPIVAKVQEMISSKIARFWNKIRENEDNKCEDQDGEQAFNMTQHIESLVNQTEQEKEDEQVMRHNFSSEEKQRYRQWLNSSDPVMDLNWSSDER